jgi:predicted amidophosphoribosyltransferase
MPQFVRRDRDPNRPRCPSCKQSRLRALTETYFCSNCGLTFKHAEAVTDAQLAARKLKVVAVAGSGVIAPPAYRYGFRWGQGWR